MASPPSPSTPGPRSETFAPPTEHDRYGPATGITFVAPMNRSRSRSIDGGKEGSVKCSLADDAKVICWSDFWQPPVVRQWIQDGRLYREAEERTPSRYELFFDLLLVGVVHQLADIAAENVSGASVAKVALTFYPAWSLWADLRNHLNSSGVDDVMERIHTLVIMCCLVGYSANASSIEVTPSTGETVTTSAELLLRRAVEAAVDGSEAPTNGEEGTPRAQHAVAAAVTFFLVAKLVQLINLAHYAVALPEFRLSYLVRLCGFVCVSLLWMGIIWAPTFETAAILAIFGIAFEIFGRLSTGVFVTLERRRAAAKEAALRERASEAAHQSSSIITSENVNPERVHRMFLAMSVRCPIPFIAFRPATLTHGYSNIEHMEERLAAFVTVVLGESVVSLLYVASDGTYGASRAYGRAVFALVVVFIFNALYFDAALSKRFVHAIRRHWFTHVIWDVSHFPLCLSLILSSAAVSKMVRQDSVPRGVRWQYGVGLGVALMCIVLTGLLHRSLDPKGAAKLNQTERAVVRSLVAIVFILIPLAKDYSDLAFLATYAGVASFLVLFELYAKLGSRMEVVDHSAVDVDREDAQESSVAK